MPPYLTGSVLYADETGRPLAAIIMCTIADLVPDAVEQGWMQPIDPEGDRVHLFVMAAGGVGMGAGWWPVFNIPYSETIGTPNTWSWPPAVPA